MPYNRFVEVRAAIGEIAEISQRAGRNGSAAERSGRTTSRGSNAPDIY